MFYEEDFYRAVVFIEVGIVCVSLDYRPVITGTY